MKNQLNTIAFTIIVFSFVLIGLACTDSTQQNNTANNSITNNNTNQSIAAQNGNANTDDSDMSVADHNCDGDSAEKIRKINRQMLRNIDRYELRPQYPRNFNFEPVADAEDNVVLYVWGFIYTKEDNVDNLNKIYKKFMKRGCVNKVVFEVSPNAKKTVGDGFEFMLCEFPNKICSDGTCQQDCFTLINTNTNSNPNTDTNSNSNKVN